MKVDLPESYIAFVLSKAKQEPSSEDLEKLRLGTISYLQHQLPETFPSLQRIELTITGSEFGANKPETRFNLYLEVQATAHFLDAPPEKNEIFERVISAFNRAYLVQMVRKLSSVDFQSAVEVEAKRLKRATPGGSVKAPAFYMGFSLSQPPAAEPSASGQKELLAKVHAEAIQQLRLAFKDDFADLSSLKIVRTAIGEVAESLTEGKCNLYVEFEAVVGFAQNTPRPIDVFQAISRCLSSELIMGIISIGGSFALITQMFIRLCIIIEFPILEECQGEGEGEVEGEPIIVKVYLEFFVALVVRLMVETPSPKQLKEFDELIVQFFSEVLAKRFKKTFVDIKLKPNPEYGAGLPLERFNMLHPYKATLQFYDPPPDGVKILQTIMRGNMGKLFEKIKGLSSLWHNTAEVTMGKAVERPATAEAFGGRIELDEELEEEKEEEDPPVPPAQKKPAPEKKKKEPAPAPPKPETEAKVPKDEQLVRVGTSDVFVAFTMPGCDFEPYNREYEALAKTTQDFYHSHLRKKFGSFEKVQVRASRTYFGKSKPNRRYNVYIEWDIKASFEADGIIPSRYELCRSLVQADLMVYLTLHVRVLEGTPFAGATGMFTEQVNSEKKE